MSILELLESIGIKAILFVAGLGGGLAQMGKKNELTFWQKITSVLTGGFAANYLTPLISDWMNFKENTLYGIAFVVGYGGLKFIEIIYLKISKLDPKPNLEK